MYPIHPYARIPLFPRPLPSFYRLKFAVDRSVARPSLYPVLRAGVGNNEGRGERTVHRSADMPISDRDKVMTIDKQQNEGNIQIGNPDIQGRYWNWHLF